jgi:hypothetical protein
MIGEQTADVGEPFCVCQLQVQQHIRRSVLLETIEEIFLPLMRAWLVQLGLGATHGRRSTVLACGSQLR